jgi:hypothetical protein
MEKIDQTISEAINEGRQGQYGKILEESESVEEESNEDDSLLSKSCSISKEELHLKETYTNSKKKNEDNDKKYSHQKQKKKIDKKERKKGDSIDIIINENKETSLKKPDLNELKVTIKNLDLKSNIDRIKKKSSHKKRKMKISDSMFNINSTLSENKTKIINKKKEKLLNTIKGNSDVELGSPKKLKPFAKSQISIHSGGNTSNSNLNKSSSDMNYSFSAIHALFKNSSNTQRTQKKRSKINNLVQN